MFPFLGLPYSTDGGNVNAQVHRDTVYLTLLSAMWKQ